MMPTPQQRILLDTPCKVCGDFSSGKHYGIHTCDGCSGFFKRSIRKGRIYTCKTNDNSCVIDKTLRNHCRKCRLRRCLEAGMQPHSVQQERGPRGTRPPPATVGHADVEEDLRHRQRHHPYQQQPLPLPPPPQLALPISTQSRIAPIANSTFSQIAPINTTTTTAAAIATSNFAAAAAAALAHYEQAMRDPRFILHMMSMHNQHRASWL